MFTGTFEGLPNNSEQRPRVEALESRLLLTATTRTNGALYPEDSPSNDKIVMAVDVGNTDGLPAISMERARSSIWETSPRSTWSPGEAPTTSASTTPTDWVEARRRLNGGHGSDTISGGARGRDYILGSFATGTLVCGGERDAIYGGLGDDNAGRRVRSDL